MFLSIGCFFAAKSQHCSVAQCFLFSPGEFINAPSRISIDTPTVSDRGAVIGLTEPISSLVRVMLSPRWRGDQETK
jgi:hypothetical protein